VIEIDQVPPVVIVVVLEHLVRFHVLVHIQNNDLHLNDNHPVAPMDVVDHVVQVSMIVMVQMLSAHRLVSDMMGITAMIDHLWLPLSIKSRKSIETREKHLII